MPFIAEIQLQYGTDPLNRELAGHIIAEQRQEIVAMRAWLKKRGVDVPLGRDAAAR